MRIDTSIDEVLLKATVVGTSALSGYGIRGGFGIRKRCRTPFSIQGAGLARAHHEVERVDRFRVLKTEWSALTLAGISQHIRPSGPTGLDHRVWQTVLYPLNTPENNGREIRWQFG
jgi:hypothetical protein